MRIIYNFLRLRNSEKIILINALIILWTIRILLWIFPFKFIQKTKKKYTEFPAKKKSNKFSVKEIIWAIEIMSRYTLNATCLNRAIAAQILLARYHYSSNIRIGVSKNEGEFGAHAWLESEGKIILGESETEYIPLLNNSEKT